MLKTDQRFDRATVAAAAVLAAVTVTVSHEAVGHGGVCLALGGEVTRLSTSLFRCSAASNLIDLGGPGMNLAVGLAAALASRIVGRGRPALRLWLVLVAAFAGFWEGAYLAKAMATGEGDLAFAWRGLIGEPTAVVRGLGVVLGVGLYAATFVFVARGLRSSAGRDAAEVARTAWVAAAVATAGAALLYRGGPGDSLRDTVLEIGVASLPLLLVRAGGEAGAPLGPRPGLIALALGVLAVFALTMGRGLGAV